ncbi:serine/threonine-protein kinase [Polyangium jinanense]|uniref:Protein kinase n=1 Tax=Polyangium jinanense TaxID=2829994 RepID=A0A9X4AR28_9BACT|nr:serine/threonine protein kinase [Polyangium jinanense]MDC3955378.1 protein kinase [Polyangium jinanense]MDC3981679.1 protein kinase [Polyangium jinanense]
MTSKQPQGGTSQADRAAQDRARGMIDRVISDRYRIRELIAMGGMGAVYRGEHLLLKKRIAIKILHPETENLPELVKRFEREAIAGAHIQHPNVASATDFGKLPDGSYFLVIEYVKGKTLHQLLQDGPLPPRRAARLTRQLASALDAIHRLDIVHRDLKPRNIMVVDGPAETVKIIDLGLAKVKVNELSAGERERQDSRASIGDEDEYGTLTVAGTIFGTIAYLSPEAADGMDAVDARSDLYALGLMFYEMLSGKHPFTAVNPVELFMQHRFQPPPAISERCPGVTVPAPLEAVVRKLLEKVPANRYQTGLELAAAIDEALWEMGPPAEGEDDAPPMSEGYDGEASMRASIPSMRPSALSQRPPPVAPSQKPPVPSQRPAAPTLPSEGTEAPVSKPVAKPILPLAQPLSAEPVEMKAAEAPAADEIELTEAPAPVQKKKKSSAGTVLTVVVGVALGCGAAYAALVMQKRNATTTPVAPQTTVTATATAAPKPPAPAARPAEVTPAATASAAPEPAASAAVPAPTMSAADIDEAKKKFKNAFRFQDWRGASRVVIDLGKGAPEAFKDREFSQLVMGLAIQLSRENADTELLDLFANDLGSDGLDILYAFVEGQGKAPIAVAATKLLQDEKRLAKASPAMRIALDLRNAACVDKLTLLDRAQKDGDFRARLVLETLGRACFPQNPNVEKVIYDLRTRFPKR